MYPRARHPGYANRPFKRPRTNSRFTSAAPYSRNPVFRSVPVPRRRVPQNGRTRTTSTYTRSIPGAPEVKFFDTDWGNVLDATGGVIIDSLCGIVQGTSQNQRIGNKVNVTRLSTKLEVSTDNTGLVTPEVLQNTNVRIIFYIDKQANGVTAAVTDILQTASIRSFRNLDQIDRFIILKDKIFKSPLPVAFGYNDVGGAHVATNTGGYWYKVNCNMNIPIHYSGTTGVMAGIKSNNVSVMWISDSPYCNLRSANTRLRFTDF